jgi:hypothetical protein
MTKLYEEGVIRPPAAALQVPVLTTSNRPNPVLFRVMKHDPLFYFDKRPEKKWDWWLKVESAATYARKFAEEGHEHFLYVDADDGFVWRSFTNADCKEFLGGKDVKLQDSNRGFPKHRTMTSACRSQYRGSPGPCAGCYIARAIPFQKYVDIIAALREARASSAFQKQHPNIFDDQACWRTLATIMPERVGIELQHRKGIGHGVLSKIFPNATTWELGVGSIQQHKARR